MEDLISFVQTHGKRKREDLACEVLALILREEPAQHVLRHLFGPRGLDESFVEVFTQVRISGCRPDIYLQQHNRVVGLLELKFWAELTNHQSEGTYHRIAPTIFVVPEDRLTALRTEVAGVCLSVISWTDLLNQIDMAAPAGQSRNQQIFAGALQHLKEFCHVIEKSHFIPFTTEQLKVRVQDVSTKHLVWLIQHIASSETSNQFISAAGRNTAGYDGDFFYGLTMHIGGLRAWVGYWPFAWNKYPDSGPIWAHFANKEAEELRQNENFGDGRSIFGQDLAFPLFGAAVTSGTQEDEVLQIDSALHNLGQRIAAR